MTRPNIPHIDFVTPMLHQISGAQLLAVANGALNLLTLRQIGELFYDNQIDANMLLKDDDGATPASWVGVFEPQETPAESMTPEQSAALCASMVTTDLQDMLKVLKSAGKALAPFTSGVFNDNGDITVSNARVATYDETVQAYFVHRTIERYIVQWDEQLNPTADDGENE